MMKKIIILSGSLLLIACGSDSSDGILQSNKIDLTPNSIINPREAIKGNWQQVAPATGCVTTVIFFDDTWSGTSANEILTGTYAITPGPFSYSSDQILISIDTDNGLTDCNASNTDNTGDRVGRSLIFVGNDTLRLSILYVEEVYIEYTRKP